VVALVAADHRIAQTHQQVADLLEEVLAELLSDLNWILKQHRSDWHWNPRQTNHHYHPNQIHSLNLLRN
jgi:hypothetical protein